MVERICGYCNQPYQTFPSIRPRYCSHGCASSAKRRGKASNCAQCGAEFYAPPSAGKRFCSKSCARTAANLTDKNPALSRDISGEKNPMFGVRRFGEANPMKGRRKEKCPHWRGGRRVMANLYVRIAVPDDYPNPSDSKAETKYALEHRVVMEQHIGRYLRPEEVVHHENGRPNDNRIENLRLFPNQAAHARHHAEEARRA